MTFDHVVRLLQIACVTLLTLILVYKFWRIQAYRSTDPDYLPVRLLSYYNKVEVYGTDQPRRREFLRFCNRLTNGFWLTLALFLVISALPYVKDLMGFE